MRVIGPGKRDALRLHLTNLGIGTEIYYPRPLHEQPCFAYLGYKPEDLPWAHRLADEVLSLPIYPELTEDDLAQVVKGIASFYGS
jgi:dTDP-4-amino-4,6-dideoxygalactose transaminase